MRMTPEAFHTWSQRLQLSAETEALIATIRASPPVRRPSGRAGNITGRYPSPKMGVSIQFESDRVEFWAIFGMERDADVLEFYDQSSRIPLSYRATSGHRTTQWHTPDFFVLRRESAGWEEWKPACTATGGPTLAGSEGGACSLALAASCSQTNPPSCGSACPST